MVDHECRCRPVRSRSASVTEPARAAAVDGDEQVHRRGDLVRGDDALPCPAVERIDSGSSSGSANATCTGMPLALERRAPERGHCRWCRRRVGRGRAPSPTSRAQQRGHGGRRREFRRSRSFALSSRRATGRRRSTSSRSLAPCTGSGSPAGTAFAATLRDLVVGSTRPASSSSMCRAVSGTVSATNVSVGVNRTPVPAPTLERRYALGLLEPGGSAREVRFGARGRHPSRCSTRWRRAGRRSPWRR